VEVRSGTATAAAMPDVRAAAAAVVVATAAAAVKAAVEDPTLFKVDTCGDSVLCRVCGDYTYSKKNTEFKRKHMQSCHQSHLELATHKEVSAKHVGWVFEQDSEQFVITSFDSEFVDYAVVGSRNAEADAFWDIAVADMNQYLANNDYIWKHHGGDGVLLAGQKLVKEKRVSDTCS